MKIFIKTKIDNNYLEIAKLFDEVLFKKLAPPLMDLEVLRFDGCKKNDEVHLAMNFQGLLNQKWISLITTDVQNEREWYFIDEGTLLPPPLKSWKHVHRIEKIDDKSSFVIDDIEFTTGNIAIDYSIYPALYAMFYFRKHIYQKELKKET